MSPRRCRTNALAAATSGAQGLAAAAPAGTAPARPVRANATTATRAATTVSLNRADLACTGRAPIALPPVRYYDQIQRTTGPERARRTSKSPRFPTTTDTSFHEPQRRPRAADGSTRTGRRARRLTARDGAAHAAARPVPTARARPVLRSN